MPPHRFPEDRQEVLAVEGNPTEDRLSVYTPASDVVEQISCLDSVRPRNQASLGLELQRLRAVDNSAHYRRTFQHESSHPGSDPAFRARVRSGR